MTNMLSYDNIKYRRKEWERNYVDMGISTTSEVIAFLKDFKKIAQCNFTFITRKKNLDSISQLGVKIKQAKSMIMGLTYENYHKGPEQDRDIKSSNVWEFGAEVDNQEVYIKLSADFGHNVAKCISFHKAEFKIDYPHKEGGNKK